MANENIGEISCAYCGGVAFVRRNAKEKLYIHCPEDGIVQPTKPNFQRYITENATMYGDGRTYQPGRREELGQEQAPEPVPETETPAAAPEPEAKPQPLKRPGLLSRLLSEDD